MKKIIILMLSLCLLTGCNQKQEYSENLFYMDTVITIKIYNKKEEIAKKMVREIENIYKKYQKIADSYANDSELWYIHNTISKEETISISPELYELLQIGLNWYEKSNGLLNINIGEVTNIWHTFREKKDDLPSNDELFSKNISINKIQLLENNQLKNTHPYLDLGSFVKGYVTELAANYLENNGISYYLINAGGNVKVGKSNKGYYSIGIASPNDNSSFYVIKDENISVVTSGGYERFYEYNGVSYHHIINPKTRYPANYMKSVTVIGKDSGVCDLLSTVLFLMDIESGQAFIKDYDVNVIWYTNDNQIIKSAGFPYE